MDSAFWRNKRVFVTGHTGFKGSWLALWLHRLGAAVSGYALAPRGEPNLFTAARVGELGTSTIGDLRDGVALERALQDSQAECVVHLAAQALVRKSHRDRLGTYATNVLGTANVLVAARNSPHVRAVVVVTSDKCYLPHENDAPHLESDALGGAGDPYSASKAGAEYVAAGCRALLNPAAIATARSGNVVGGGDWSLDRLVPDAMRSFSTRKELAVRNPGHVRPWQHVLDPLRGYLMLANTLLTDPESAADAFNFGPGASDAATVADVAARLARFWGDGAAWQPAAHSTNAGEEEAKEAPALRLDSRKACERLGWAPRLTLDAALERTVLWHRRFNGGEDARTLVLADIAEYERAS